MPGKRSPRNIQESESSDDDDVSDTSQSSVSDEESDSDQVFCKCGQGNTKDMIGCDGQDCPFEWFHFKCVGIDPKHIPRGKWLCGDCKDKQDKEELKRAPSGQYVVPVSNPVIKKQTTTVQGFSSDATMTKSLCDAEKRHANNLKRACKAVLWDGLTVGNAATQFQVGRYVLADYVKGQLEVSLNCAYQDVISKKYTVEEAAQSYGIPFKTMMDCMKAKKDTATTSVVVVSDPKAPLQPAGDGSLEKNLHMACMDIMSSRCTLIEASKIYKINASTIENKLRTVLVLTTEEEDELVQMCLKMSKEGHTGPMKNAVTSKVKALLDDEERRGIKRVHAFPYNMPDTFWWETFCSLHPEVKVKEVQPKPSESPADKVYYILPTPKEKDSKFVLVKQDSLPDSEAPPVTKSLSEVVSSAQPSASNQPEPAGNSNNLNNGDQQDSDTSPETSSLNLPNPEAAADREGNQLSPGGTEEQNCPVVSEKVSEDTGVTSSLGSESPVSTPSLSIADDEVQHPGKTATNEAAQPDAVIGDEDLPDIKVALAPDTSIATDQASGKETVQASEAVGANQAGQVNQNVVRVVLDSSLPTSTSTHTDLVAASTDIPILDMNKTPNLIAVLPNPVTQPDPAPPQPSPMVAQPKSVIIQIKQLVGQPNTVVGQPSLVRLQSGTGAVQANLVTAGPSYSSVAAKGPPTVFVIESRGPIPKHKQIYFSEGIPNQNSVMYSTQPVTAPNTVTVKVVSEPNMASSGAHNSQPSTTQANVGQLPRGSQMTSGNSSRADLRRSFIFKSKIDKTIPDALTCLEKTLSEEQKASFAFRLQIGDDRRDDLKFNAWKALKRLYHHADIYSLYDKTDPHAKESPPNFDLPVACKLLQLPLMDPTKDDQQQPGEGQTGSEQRSKILTELCRGRKKRKIAAKLVQREANRRPPKKARKFLEPWKFEMKKPNKRKNFISTCLRNTFINMLSDDEDSLGEETETLNPLDNPEQLVLAQ